jgi:hypothetical protein
MVVLSRDEVMEVLPESDWTYLADARGAVAERWLCFFTRNRHSAESHSEGAAYDYIAALSEEDKRAYGTCPARLGFGSSGAVTRARHCADLSGRARWFVCSKQEC